jgi:uncharacterized protein (TIGR04255 family)
VASQPTTLRDFSSPPVVETVLGVQFAPLSFAIPHFGLYWSRIQSEFPQYRVLPPLGHVREQFGAPSGGTIWKGIELVQELDIRCWFLDKPGNQIIQIQRDRFIYNWQKISGSEVYPRYENVRVRFEAEWRQFRDFLEESGFGKPEVNQCEVTYVNHLEYGKGWKSFGELNKVISCWSGKHSGTFLPEPEKVSMTVNYLLPDNQGRMYVSLEPVLRTRDAKEVLQLNLTVRGAPSSSAEADVLQWLDIGRQWIVEGFTDFTTDAMHKLWGRSK